MPLKRLTVYILMKQMYFGRNRVGKIINEVVHTSNRAFYVF